MKRLFAAIKIKPKVEFLEIFQGLKQDLKHEKIKWVESYNLHLTLKFFGETDEERIPEIIAALKASVNEHQHFSFDISKIGIFGSSYNPKVVWAGLTETDSLIKLEASVKCSLEGVGYVSDRQNFVPHLTLGRIKNLKDKDLFQDIISNYKEKYFQEVSVKKVYLFESTITKTGPVYTIIEEFNLKA